MPIDACKLSLEVNTLFTGLVARFGTRLGQPEPLGFNASDGDKIMHEEEELGWALNAVVGDVAFLILCLSIIINFFLQRQQESVWSLETRHQLIGIIASLRMVAIFPFTLLVVLYKVQEGQGVTRLWGVLCAGCLMQYIGHLTISPVWEARAIQRSIELSLMPSDVERGRRTLSGQRKEVPADAKIETEATGEGSAGTLPRACHMCNDALPNTRCRPCQHSSACEPCLLRWASVAREGRVRCPVCSRDIDGYDVAAEPGGYFLHTFLESSYD